MHARALGVSLICVGLTAGLALAGGGAALPRGRSKEYREALGAIDAMARAKPPSVSTGSVSKGGLKDAAELPARGFGYRLASPTRKTHFGSDAMVFGIMEIAALVQERRPRSPFLSVGDISGPEGGKLSPHINHQDGKDLDLSFLYSTPAGEPVDRGWLKCDAGGKTKQASVVFDVARNFELMVLWVESPFFGGCEWIFVHEPLAKLLVEQGRDLARRDPRRADALGKVTTELEKLLREPESSPHDDHFHIRIRGGRGWEK